MPFAPPDEASFQLPPPAPPEGKTAWRVILVASAVAHVVLFAVFAGRHADAPPPPPPQVTGDTRVLQGEVTTTPAGETTGLRLAGYRDVTLGLSPAR